MARAILLAVSVLGYSTGIDPGAQAIVDRTRQTTATYAVHLWGGSVENGVQTTHWSSEIHSGDRHRLEGPRMRVIVNCRTRMGHVYDVEKKQFRSGVDVFPGACGIYQPPDVSTVERLPSLTWRGKALDRLRITDSRFVRHYLVDDKGAIHASDWVSRESASSICIRTRAMAVEYSLPAADIFSQRSLERAVTPLRYQTQRSSVPSLDLSGQACGSLD